MRSPVNRAEVPDESIQAIQTVKSGGMNRLPKGRARMAELGRIGAARSAEARQHNALELRMFRHLAARAVTGYCFEDLAQAVRPVDFTGGNHDLDWLCPQCGHFNGARRWLCAKSISVAPAKGRVTRARLRERGEI